MRATLRRFGVASLAVLATVSTIGVTQAGADANTDNAGAAVEVRAGDGSLVVVGSGEKFVPRGFNSVGVLYPKEYPDMCAHLDENLRTELKAVRDRMDGNTAQQFDAMREYWNANAVRLQTSQGALATENRNGAADDPYTDAVIHAIETAREQGLVALVSVQTQTYSCTAHVNNEPVKLPNEDTLAAWRQLTPELRDDQGVVLEIFNEPQTKNACDTGKDWSWPEWRYGCDADPDTGVDGMIPLAERVNRLAPDNVLLFDGDNNGGKFNGFEPVGIPDNSAYAAHPYFYADGPDGNDLGEGWNVRFGHLQQGGKPLLATEWNGSLSCNPSFADMLVDRYLPTHDTGLFVHSWDAPAAVLVDHNSGDYGPVDSVPKCESFTGASLAYSEFWNWGPDWNGNGAQS